MFAPPHNGQVFLLASYDRATYLIAPLITNSPSPTIITPDRVRVPTPSDISDLLLTRGAPHAYIHSCPTYRVRGVSPDYADRALIAQAYMDGHHTGLSALARDHNKLQGLLVLHTSSDISTLGRSVSRTLLSLPNLFLCRLLTHATTRMVSNFRAFRTDGVIARATNTLPGLCRAEFRILERSIAPSGPHA
jgi:hypothetical protein